MDQELRAAIKAAVLADQAPDIIQAIKEEIKAESDRLQGEWSKSGAYDTERAAEEKATREGKWREWERSQRRPLWCWWSFFGHQLEYVVRSMREELAQREMTQGELEDARKAEEIRRKRDELARLERA